MSSITRRLTFGVFAVFGVLGVLGVLALAACGTPKVTLPPIAPPSAQTILQNVQKAQFNDATFTLNFTGSFSGTSTTGTGNGKITKNPERYYISLTVPVSGQQVTIESITDVSTNTEYSRISILSDKWIKSVIGSSSSSIFDTSQITSYAKDIKNPVLVGSDNVDGTDVWHVKGTETQGSSDGTVDLYATKDKFLPKKVVITTTGTNAGTFTLLFTSFDTGITIALPPADQVQGS